MNIGAYASETLIGASVGAGLALWDYLIDPSEPGNVAVDQSVYARALALKPQE